ncbi:MAG: tetratricopeptide repeat protein, partial [Saprospiraceae bacterium]|nr:tetratricopeptide repeat protein [Saprospiraceae bacterium]
VFMQESDYGNALKQAKALDKRLNENGSRIYRLAQTALREENYQAGIDAYAYIISKGRMCPYYIDAKQQILAAKRKRLVKGYAYTLEDLKIMEKEYEDFLDEFGRNRESSKIMRELAQFEAKYLNNNDKAISILEEVIKIPSISRNNRNESKIELGDYYLMKGEVWEATLLYSQVDKEMDDAPLGEEARFKNAKLSYYKGDFEWSQDQLEILKGSTSELIANDAIDLSVFIMDHYNLDTTARPMMMFANAQLLNFQNRFEESFTVMDSIIDIDGKHGLVDDIYFTKAKIYIQKREYPQAIKLLEEIIEKHGDGILADNAIFTLAELHEERLNQPDDAKELYQKILFDYSGSILAVEAGKRFRRLRGDMSSDGKVTPPWKTNNQ